MATSMNFLIFTCMSIMVIDMSNHGGIHARKPKQAKCQTRSSNPFTNNAPCPGRSKQGNPSGSGNSRKTRIKLRIMSFNMWVAGNNVADGVNKIVRHIQLSNADIILAQESSDGDADNIVRLLGAKVWRRCNMAKGNVSVITKHAIAEDYPSSDRLWNAGCRLRVSDNPLAHLNVWTVYVDWRYFGGYTACITNKTDPKLQDILTVNEYKSIGYEYGRMNNVIALLKHEPFSHNMRDSNVTPMVVAGDFNSPSHLDWTPAAKKLHCNVSFVWPVTKTMADMGFLDSYRTVHQDPVKFPGSTWSAIYRYYTDDPTRNTPEPQCRIDYIFSKGAKLKPVTSQVFNGLRKPTPFPDHHDNEWPSDHNSVITDFVLSV